MTKTRTTLFFALMLGAIAGCGVKGDPIPPKEPAFIGRGEPGFQRASESLDIDESETQYRRKKKGEKQ